MSHTRNVIHFWDSNRVNMMKCSNVNNCNCTHKNLKIALFFSEKIISDVMIWPQKPKNYLFYFPKHNQHFLSRRYFFSAWNKYITANLEIKHTFLMEDCDSKDLDCLLLSYRYEVSLRFTLSTKRNTSKNA